MAELKPEQLATQVESGPLRPVYLIAGPEPLRVLEAADAVRAAARAQGISEREIFEAEGNQREPDWSAMEASFRAPSLFSSKRLFELRLPSGKPGTEGARVISEFCADPPADITLLVTAGDWSRQHGGKWSEAIGRVGCDRDRVAGQAARIAGLDRTPPARARAQGRSRCGATAGRSRRGQSACGSAGNRETETAVGRRTRATAYSTRHAWKIWSPTPRALMCSA